MEKFFSRIFERNRILSVIELGRPWNAVIIGLLPVLGLFIGGGYSLESSAMLFFIFVSAYLGGATLNDIYDEKIDSINMPYRPLTEKRVNKNTAWLFLLLMHISAIIASLVLDFKIFILLVLFFIGSFFYSMPPMHMSRRGLLSHIDLIFASMFIPLYSGIVYSLKTFLPQNEIIMFMLSFSLFSIFVFLLKDFKDVKGDNAYNKKTPVILWGKKNTQKISIIGVIISSALTILFLSMIVELSFLTYLLFLPLLSALIFFQSNVINNPEKSFGGARLILFLFILLILSNVF